MPTLGGMSPVPGCVAGCGRRAGSSATTKTNSTWTPPTRNSAARLCSPTWKGFAGSSDIIIRYPEFPGWFCCSLLLVLGFWFSQLVAAPGAARAVLSSRSHKRWHCRWLDGRTKDTMWKDLQGTVVSLLSRLSCCSMQCVVIAVICIRFESVDNWDVRLARDQWAMAGFVALWLMRSSVPWRQSQPGCVNLELPHWAVLWKLPGFPQWLPPQWQLGAQAGQTSE